jgi:hypothetical protein
MEEKNTKRSHIITLSRYAITGTKIKRCKPISTGFNRFFLIRRLSNIPLLIPHETHRVFLPLFVQNRNFAYFGANKLEAVMTLRITQNLLDLLADLADYRMLSMSQVAYLHFQGKRQARRRMQQLLEEGLVDMLPGCQALVS